MRAIIRKNTGVAGSVALLALLISACGSGVKEVTEKASAGTVNPVYTGKTAPAQVTSENAPVLANTLTGANDARSLEQIISSIFSSLVPNFKPSLGPSLSSTQQLTSNCATPAGQATSTSEIDALGGITNSITFNEFCTSQNTTSQNAVETVISSGTSTQELKTTTGTGDGTQTTQTVNVGFQAVKALGMLLDGTISLNTTDAGSMGGMSEVAILYRLARTALNDNNKQSALNLDVITSQDGKIKINGKVCQQDEGCVDIATDDQDNISISGAGESKLVLTPVNSGGYQASLNGEAIAGNVNLDLTALGSVN